MKTILCVEDDDLNRNFIKKLIEINNFRAVMAASAEEGLEIAAKNPPDLILMDITLGGMDGITATQKLKSDVRLKNIPVIALSAYAMQDYRDAALKAGCSDFITKPIDLKAFAEVLKKYLS
ncbi:MAG: response regulator [Spirochaetales bacterium]|nr:response regulator [Spirochaetales bacterium]